MTLFRSKILRCILVALILLVNIPVTGFAEGEEEVLTGGIEIQGLEDINKPNPSPTPIPSPTPVPIASLEIISETVVETESWPGETVEFTFTVQNTGNVLLKDVAVIDSLDGKTNSDGHDDVDMSPQEIKIFKHKYLIPNGTRETISNKAYAQGVWQRKSPIPDVTVTSDEKTLQVKLLWPDIEIEKTVDPTEAFYGQTVEFTFKVTNTGTVPLYDIALADAELDYRDTLPKLGAGDSYEFVKSYTIPCEFVVPQVFSTISPSPSATFYNQATVTGWLESKSDEASIDVNCRPSPSPEPRPDYVTATDDASVSLKHEKLGLMLTKHAQSTEIIEPTDVSYREGPVIGGRCLLINDKQTTVYYFFDLYNTSNVPLHDLVIYDEQLGEPIVLNEFFDREVVIPVEGHLEVGPIPFSVVGITEWPLINTATAEGKGYCGEVLSQEATSCINLASIMIDKKVVPTTALVGDEVEYTLVITNKGNVNLYDVKVTDNQIAYSTSITKLEVGGSATYTVPYTVQTKDIGEFVNVASVMAATALQVDEIFFFPYMEVTDEDDAVLMVVVPATPTPQPTPEPEVTPTPIPQPEPTETPIIPENDEPVGPQEEEVTTEAVPLALPVIEEEEESLEPEALPLAVPVLPKTSEIPASFFYGLGGIFSGIGLYLRRRTK